MAAGRSRARLLSTVLAGALVASAVAPDSARAQGREGFLLNEPRVTLGFHMGYAVPNASSEVFDFVQDELTVDKSDFNAPTLGGQLAVRVSPRVDVRFEVAYSRSETRSEFRDWVDLDNLPIEQDTYLQRVPVTVGLKWYLDDRGRSVGRFAWIPDDWNAYLGAAAGATWYRFEQEGDFVDFETLDIFTSAFSNDGSATTAQLYGGVDHTLAPHFMVTLEGRYSWSEAVEMTGDFVGFEPMDLSGFQATVGISARF